MKLSILAGSTSQTINIFIQDSSSTTGAGLTGLVFNSGSLTAYYALPRAAATSITLATQTVTGSYSSGGFVEISSSNMPGWYRFDIPDAAIASGRFSNIHFKGASNMAPLPIEIELTGWNNQDAVHGGMSALPNTACTTNASLLTSGTGTDQISVTSGRVDTGKISGTSQTARDIGASVLLSSGTGTGQLSFTSGVVKSDPWPIALPGSYTSGTAGYILGNLAAGADPWSTALPGAYSSGQAGFLVGTYVNASIAAVKAKTDSLTFTVSNQVDANALKIGGTTQTGRDLGASVLLSNGTGTGQVSLSSGRVAVQSNTVTDVGLNNFEFVMVDSAGIPRTGLSVTPQRSIDGGAFGAASNAVSEISNGLYKINLSAGDLNGSVITLRFTATGAQDRLITVIMVP
jgi:hypothetical protein